MDELYHAWIDRYDTLTEQKRNQALAEMEHFQSAPLISIVVPTYNSDVRFLQEMIESVRHQLYPHWELCIADDASTSESVKQVLEAARAQDERIKVASSNRFTRWTNEGSPGAAWYRSSKYP
ncbi:hypothetical protein VU09_00425 [Burkholderia pseudomallei]|nr:hypothetical protein VU09_00425 [Burkholderia pseudomallei]